MRTLGKAYLAVGAFLAVFGALLVAVMRMTPARAVEGGALIQPALALVGLTAIVTLLMVAYRNFAIIRGAVSEHYFRAFTEKPAEWVERPTRTYMNLLELPLLFYVACLFMLATRKFDALQVALAWLFVASRYVHAFIYIGFNYVPLRFAAYLSGVVTLAVLWTRFAQQAL